MYDPKQGRFREVAGQRMKTNCTARFVECEAKLPEGRGIPNRRRLAPSGDCHVSPPYTIHQLDETVRRVGRRPAAIPRGGSGLDPMLACFIPQRRPSGADCRRCRRLRLNRLEREILVALILNHLAMLPEGFHDTRGLFQILTRPDSKPLEGFRALSDHGRLVKAGLVDFDDPESDLAERTPQVDPAFVNSVVTQEHEKEAGWPVKTEAELLDRLPPLVHALMEKSESMLAVMKGRGSHRLQREERKARHLMHKLKETLKQHADWKLNELRGNLESPEFRIFVVLLGKYLGFAPDNDDNQKVCTGGGLARAVSSGIEHVGDAMQYLQADWPLTKKG